MVASRPGGITFNDEGMAFEILDSRMLPAIAERAWERRSLHQTALEQRR